LGNDAVMGGNYSTAMVTKEEAIAGRAEVRL